MTARNAREPVTREAFAKAGLELVDDGGIEALSTRALGEALGVHGTTVYRHFANMDDLREAVLDHMLRTSGVSVPETGSPRDRLAELMRSLRAAFAQHPNLAIPNLTSQGEQASSAFVAAALDLLAEMGLHGRKLVVAYQMLETFIVGSTAYDWGGYPDALEARRRGRRLLAHPAFDESSRSLESMQELTDDVFDAMVDALLDACEGMAVR